MMTASRRDTFKEPGVLPVQPTVSGLRPDAAQLLQRRLELSVFPTGNRCLGGARDPGHVDLGHTKYVDADQLQRVHTPTYIRQRINNQLKIATTSWAVDIPWRISQRMNVGAILRGVMAARGWNQDELADQLDTTQATVSRWLAGAEPKGGSMERIRALAVQSGVIERERVASNQAAIMGRVGAGAEIDVEFEQTPPEGYDMVELPFSYPDPVIAFEVEGESQLPVYEPGDVIVCLREQVRSTDHYLGERVVVRLSTGERYVKRLARGFRNGTYNLESWNAHTIEDVRVEWVGEIVGSVPRGAIRRIDRRSASKVKRPAVNKAEKPRQGAKE